MYLMSVKDEVRPQASMHGADERLKTRLVSKNLVNWARPQELDAPAENRYLNLVASVAQQCEVDVK